jgi:hypothetical protein
MKYGLIDLEIQRTLRRLGFDNAYARFRGGSYETSETIGKYRVEFETQESGDLQFIIWNPDFPCLAIYIHKDNGIATLSRLDYSPECTTNGNMLRGQGTREMLEFAFDLAKSQGAKSIQLNDQSVIVCGNGEKVKLGHFYFIRYGMTWYEKYFGFKPTSEYREEYELAKVLRHELPLDELKSKSCEYFDRKTMNALMRKVELDFGDIVWEKTL